MESNNNISNGNHHQDTDQLIEANADFCNHLFSFIKSMSLKCGVHLGIPDAIHKHGKPMTLSELRKVLPVHPQKVEFLPQLMRMLTHLGYLYVEVPHSARDDYEFAYSLTCSGELLLGDHPFSTKPYLMFVLDSSFLKPWLDLSSWFKNEVDETPFHLAHGMRLWEYVSGVPEISRNINETFVNDSQLVSSVLIQNKHLEGVLEGMSSLVDVGGGLGGMANAIAKAFPNIKCSVLDQPHVLEGQKDTANITYVAGDMFHNIPPADVVLLKLVLHDWCDEDCEKILKQCKIAITSNENGKRGKVIIVDVVMAGDDHNKESKMKTNETQILHDMEMLCLMAGKERTEKEWKKLFEDAGFLGGYKIHLVLGFRSLIEVYP